MQRFCQDYPDNNNIQWAVGTKRLLWFCSWVWNSCTVQCSLYRNTYMCNERKIMPKVTPKSRLPQILDKVLRLSSWLASKKSSQDCPTQPGPVCLFILVQSASFVQVGAKTCWEGHLLTMDSFSTKSCKSHSRKTSFLLPTEVFQGILCDDCSNLCDDRNIVWCCWWAPWKIFNKNDQGLLNTKKTLRLY